MKGYCPSCDKDAPADAVKCPDCSTDLLQVAEDSLVGRTIDGRYTVLRELGRGGMGAVYVAKQKYLGREVALKVLLHSLSSDEAYVKRFLREARVVAGLKDPHTITVHEFGITDDDLLYFTMELLEGVSLSQIIRERGALPPERVALIVEQACQSLTEAHDKGLVHRDLKPDNIFISRDTNYDDFVTVLDFGIAKPLDQAEQLTVTGIVCGTPQYLSPEQATGKNLRASSDLYSLGILVFEMLTGTIPFQHKNLTQILIDHLDKPPPALSDVRNDLPFSLPLEAFVTRALAKSPADRPPNARAFSQELRRAVETPAARIGRPSKGDTADLFPGRRADTTPGHPVPPVTPSKAASGPSAETHIVDTQPPTTRVDPLDPLTETAPTPQAVAAEERTTATEFSRPTKTEAALADTSYAERPTRARRWPLVILGLLIIAGTVLAILRPWKTDAPPPSTPAADAPSGPRAGAVEAPPEAPIVLPGAPDVVEEEIPPVAPVIDVLAPEDTTQLAVPPVADVQEPAPLQAPDTMDAVEPPVDAMDDAAPREDRVSPDLVEDTATTLEAPVEHKAPVVHKAPIEHKAPTEHGPAPAEVEAPPEDGAPGEDAPPEEPAPPAEEPEPRQPEDLFHMDEVPTEKDYKDNLFELDEVPDKAKSGGG